MRRLVVVEDALSLERKEWGLLLGNKLVFMGIRSGAHKDTKSHYYEKII